MTMLFHCIHIGNPEVDILFGQIVDLNQETDKTAGGNHG